MHQILHNHSLLSLVRGRALGTSFGSACPPTFTDGHCFFCDCSSLLWRTREYACVSVYLCVFMCKAAVGDPHEWVFVGIVMQLSTDTSGSTVMIRSPTLDPIMVLETRTFPSPSVIAGGKKRHLWITTATWIYTWITTATWSISPWLQPAERASLACSPTHSFLYFPVLSFPWSAPLFNSEVLLSLDTHIDKYTHIHLHDTVTGRQTKQERFWALFLLLCLLFLAAGERSQVAEIDSLSKLHDTQLTTLSTAQTD